ncbi:hypothetical protein BS78_09G042000 [Paspalum vaginatum]|nr:hypothetical protein BS78_09G042000 [Paspalum vaginatum]
MTQEEGREASWSRSSRTRRRRRRRASTGSPTSPTVTTRRRRTPAGTPTSPKVTTQSRETQSGSPPPSTTSKGRKRARASGGCDMEEIAEQEASSAVASPPAEHASSGESSAVSSPLRWPSLPRAVIGEDASGKEVLEPVFKMNPRLVAAYHNLTWKCREKRNQQMKLVTLCELTSESCLMTEKLLQTRESATKTVLQSAKVVIGLSSYVDGALLSQTSGFLINWDEENKIGTILTSALLICSKSPSVDEWSGTGEYIPEAEVHVHLLDKDDSVVVAELLHYDKNYNLAIFKAVMNLCAEVPSFGDVKFGQEVFVLGRDKNLDLNIDHGLVQYMGPSRYERHHYMFINCVLNKIESGIGGLVIDFNGQIMGMVVNIPGMKFIPSSIILNCLHMWRKFGFVPRLHIGMKLSSIKFLDPVHVEKISRKCNVDSGLIVKEVSHESNAENLGVRVGDIIESMNGKCITTTVELENELMRICENHLDQGGVIGSSMEIQVGIFNTRKCSSCSRSLRLNVSNDAEVFVKCVYVVSEKDYAPTVA